MQIKETKLSFKSGMKQRNKTNRFIIHHTASQDVPASTIHQWHLNQGWSGIGYHFVIRQNGDIERGRAENLIGAHAGEKGNPDSIGIVLTGKFETGKPTAAQMESLVWLLRDCLFPKYGQLQVMGHKDVMATACPGKNFPWVELRERLEDDEMIYKTFNDVPDWGKSIIKKLMDRKTIVGDGKGNIDLPDSTLKTLVYLEREGVLK